MLCCPSRGRIVLARCNQGKTLFINANTNVSIVFETTIVESCHCFHSLLLHQICWLRSIERLKIAGGGNCCRFKHELYACRGWFLDPAFSNMQAACLSHAFYAKEAILFIRPCYARHMHASYRVRRVLYSSRVSK